MDTPSINENELTDHDRQMIEVAEQGDPNAPDDNKDVTLPSEVKPDGTPELPEGIESVEDLIAKFNELNKSTDEEQGDEESDSENQGEEQEESEGNDELEQTKAQLREMKAYEAVGGKENYQELTQWAGDNLEDAQIDVYNEVVTKGSPAQVEFATKALMQMAELHKLKSYGSEGDMTLPNSGMPQSGTGYESEAEMMRDMADPRYQYDEAYQAKVMQKVAAAKF